VAGSAAVASAGVVAAAGGAGYLGYKDITIIGEIIGTLRDLKWSIDENNRLAEQER
jgi:hypothetical protein